MSNMQYSSNTDGVRNYVTYDRTPQPTSNLSNDPMFPVFRVLNSNQEITETKHVGNWVQNVPQYQSNYIANNVRPSATFVNAIIPDISSRRHQL